MSFVDVGTPIERASKDIVLTQTWGHLAPKYNKAYTGVITFCRSAYGDVIVIDDEFDGMGCSPWFYQHSQEFAGITTDKLGIGTYMFTGTYRMLRKGAAKAVFTGEVLRYHLTKDCTNVQPAGMVKITIGSCTPRTV